MPNIDRRDDEMPTQSMAMRYQSPYPRKTSPEAPSNFKAAIQKAAKDPENEGAQKLAPTLRFCGGMSKPYKK
tara:strand:- start:78 stop:293 length:216 start_codon:yes stop_codon:yes gene_type:complete